MRTRLLLVALLAAAAAAPADAGQLVLENVTITDNVATERAGGLWAGISFTLRNTVIAQNHSLIPYDCLRKHVFSDGTSGGYNFIGVGGEPAEPAGIEPCLNAAATGDQIGSEATPLDAELGLLDDHGGTTLTHDLGPLSPLRDAGDPDGCDDQNGVPLDVDQRGEARPQGAECDIGAFESPPPGDALAFYTVTPCRLFDSRFEPPALLHGVERDVDVGGFCGVPTGAAAASTNLTAVQATDAGGVNAYALDAAPPPDSTLRFLAGATRANNAIVALADDGLSAQASFDGGAAGSVDLVVDVNGYFLIDSPPVALDDAAAIPYDAAATAIAVLSNDSDAEGDAFLIAAVTQPLHGIVAITGGGTGVTYDPTDGYCSIVGGTRQGPADVFSYEIAPGGASAVVKVDLTCGCFAGETLVWTETGPRPIAEIRPADRVWARDELSGATRLAPVASVSSHTARSLLRIRVGDEELRVTSEHPFWISGQWTRAGALAAGNVLTTHDGAALPIRAIERLDDPETVYNLHVDELHTFFVGAAGVWVHNK